MQQRGSSSKRERAWDGCDVGADVAARLSDCRLSTRAELSPEPPHTPHSSTAYPACRVYKKVYNF